MGLGQVPAARKVRQELRNILLVKFPRCFTTVRRLSDGSLLAGNFAKVVELGGSYE